MFSKAKQLLSRDLKTILGSASRRSSLRNRERGIILLSLAEVESNFAAHVPRVVVLGKESFSIEEAMADAAKTSLRAHGYTLVRSIGDTSIYVCCAKP
jgi:hypothetical protein